MCGQFAVFGGLQSVIDYYNFLRDADFDVDYSLFINDCDTIFDYYKNENHFKEKIVKPMDTVPIFTYENKKTRVLLANWGLIPFWVKDKLKGIHNDILFAYSDNKFKKVPDKINDFVDISFAYKTINARIETIKEKPSFKYAYRQRRCLIPFKGFYETSADNRKYLFLNTNNVFKSFAGLYEIWKNDIVSIRTFTIITTMANQNIKEIHHRMPVVLNKDKALQWLDYKNEKDLFVECKESFEKKLIS